MYIYTRDFFTFFPRLLVNDSISALGFVTFSMINNNFHNTILIAKPPVPVYGCKVSSCKNILNNLLRNKYRIGRKPRHTFQCYGGLIPSKLSDDFSSKYRWTCEVASCFFFILRPLRTTGITIQNSIVYVYYRKTSFGIIHQ